MSLLDELESADCWCGRTFEECEEGGGCKWTRALASAIAERDEAQSEAAMIRDHANRYLKAVYGPDYVYRAPETFGNLVERWIWAVSAGLPEMAHACIAEIERHCAERDAEGADGD